MVVICAEKARWPQTVAIQSGADLAPVAERDRRRPVPRLHQRGVIFVESPPLGVHQRIAGPGFRDQHHHGVGQRIAAGDQQFQRVVQVGGVRLAMRDQRPHLVQIRTQQRRFQRAPARVHPVDVAALGVDLAVVGDEPVGVGQPPGREGVGREPLVHHGQRRLGQRVGQILVKGPDLTRQQQALIDHRAAGKRRHIEVGDAGQIMLDRQGGQGILRLLADRQQLTLKGVLVLDARAAPDNGLADHRHLVEHGLA